MNKYIKIFLFTISVGLFLNLTLKLAFRIYHTQERKKNIDSSIEEIIERQVYYDIGANKTCDFLPKGVNRRIYLKDNKYGIEVLLCVRNSDDTVEEISCGIDTPYKKLGRKPYGGVRCSVYDGGPPKTPKVVIDYVGIPNIQFNRYWQKYIVYREFSDTYLVNKLVYYLYDGKTVRKATDKETKLIYFLNKNGYY